MAKTHSSLTGADLHAPQGFVLENATEIWHVTQSVNKVNVSVNKVNTSVNKVITSIYKVITSVSKVNQ